MLTWPPCLIFLIVGVTHFQLINGIRKEYDFIIVGSGPGGSTVARRLAESGQFNVLLIEAGSSPKFGFSIPANNLKNLLDPSYTFRYATTPQKDFALKSGGVLNVISGKALGGSSYLNYMVWNRGHPKDYDNWANLTGDNSWSYKNMLPYMKKSENYKATYPTNQHGYDGPLTVYRPKYAPGMHEYWFPAGKELGYSIGDPNGPQKVMFAPFEFAMQKGHRVSAFYDMVMPILDSSPNLEVLAETFVTEICFSGKKAIGVKVHTAKIPNWSHDDCIHATNEVIVSGGASQSPLLLQRSGIGPYEALDAAGIPLIKDLPVGRHLQDHPVVAVPVVINDPNASFNQERDLNVESLNMYYSAGDGPYTNVFGTTAQAFFASSMAEADGHPDWPDFQLHSFNQYAPVFANMDQFYFDVLMKLPKDQAPIYIAVFLGRPKSVGSIKITPNDTFGSPIYDPKLFSDPRDLQVSYEGIEKIVKILETSAYKKIKARIVLPSLPDCDSLPARSKEYWKCFIKHMSCGGVHTSGTNKMGRADDPTAVVDTQLRVIGIENLRVVDGSVFPSIPNANPQAAVYAVAEKASEMILNAHRDTPCKSKPKKV